MGIKNRLINQFGRFWWLFVSMNFSNAYTASLSAKLIPDDAVSEIGIMLLLMAILWGVGGYLLFKAIKSDNKNNISALPSRNILLPWPKTAVLLLLLILAEIVVCVFEWAYSSYPCGSLDFVRKNNGCIAYIPNENFIQSMAFSGDGKIFVLSGYEGSVEVWSYPEMTLLNNLGNGWPSGAEFALSSRGDLIAICASETPLRLMETMTGKSLYTLSLTIDGFCDVAFSPDDKFVVSISDDGIQTWDVATGNLVSAIPQDDLEFLKITPDGKYLAVAHEDGEINIRRSQDGKIVATMQEPHLADMAISLDSKYLIIIGKDISKDSSVEDNSVVTVWNIKDGTLESSSVLSQIRIDRIAISRNGVFLAGGSENCGWKGGTLFGKPCAYFWKTSNSKALVDLKIPDDVDAIISSPIDDIVLIGSYKGIFVWRFP